MPVLLIMSRYKYFNGTNALPYELCETKDLGSGNQYLTFLVIDNVFI